MIDAAHFVEAARRYGFEWYSGVPCSFLTPFINYVLQDASLNYLPAANEGDAVASIAGVTLGGRRGVAMMQNSGLGNAVSPLTSLTWTLRLPQLLIVTWRGQPGVADEPQHELMGRITPQVLDSMEIPWEVFPSAPSDIAGVLKRASAHLDDTGRPYALIMRKGTVRAQALEPRSTPPRTGSGRVVSHKSSTALPRRRDVLERILAATSVDSDVIVATTGFTGRELYSIDDRPNHLYMVGSMGCASSLGLGLALARPDLRVVVIDGDGAALMRMGAFATLGALGPSNLVHLVLDNGVHESTGGQATVSPRVSFAGVAAACGYGLALEGDDADIVDQALTATTSCDRPVFGHIVIEPGTAQNLPRPALTPVEVKERLMKQIFDAEKAM